MKCDEIFAALAMLEKERGISQTFMMDKIVQALTTAYKRDHEGVENVVVDVDEGKRELKMFVQKEVVDEVENPGTQMSLDDAKAISAKYNVGDIVNIPVDNIEFGRIAAGNGKQVIIQKLLIPVDLKKIKDLEQLLALLKEAEDYAEANGSEEPADDQDAEPAPA